MNLYSFILGVAVIVNTVIGFAVLGLGPRRMVNRFFAVSMLGFALWGLGVYIARVSTETAWAVFGLNVAAIGWCFVGTLYLHFTLVLTGKNELLRKTWVYFLLYIPPTVLLMLIWFTDLTHKTEAIMIGNFRVTPGLPLSHVTQTYTVAMFALSLVLLLMYWHSSVRHFSKTHELYFIVLCSMTAVAALFTEIILPIFGVYTVDIPVFVALAITPIIAYGLVTRGFVISLETALGDAVTRILHDPVVLVDYKGSIEHVNPAVLSLTGYSEREILSMSFNSVFDVRGFTFSEQETGDISLGNKELGRCVTREGEWIPVEVSWATLHYGGMVVGFVVVAHDMRDAFELIQAEEIARVATVEAKAQRRLTDNLREVINIAAHELRHPAAAIRGSMMLISPLLEGSDDPAVETAVGGMKAAEERLAHLANELSDMSHIEGGGLRLYYSECNPDELVKIAVEQVKSRYSPAEIFVNENGHSNDVRVDEDKIEEVL
ncbi:MAG: PAS domain S-box protein, partial [Actinobacteria bacterium]|nr:PAS domain S-box protein [Actinomycetota bacterium]